jgi:hypothetical protein
MKPFKTKPKPLLKNVNFSWYIEIILKILKEKPTKSMRIKAHLDVSIMYPLGINVLTNKNKSFQKDF